MRLPFQLRVTLWKNDITTNVEYRDTVEVGGKLKKVDIYPEFQTTYKIVHIDRYFISYNIEKLKEVEAEYRKRHTFYESEIKEIDINDEVLEVE